MTGSTSLLAAVALLSLSLAPTAYAQSSFDEGSFNEPPRQTQPSVTGTGAAVGGFGDGSFEPGGGATPGSVTLPETPGGGSAVAGNDTVPGGTVSPGDGGTVSPGGNGGTVTPQPNATSQVDPQIIAFETRDFGVPAQNTLRQGQFHAPTPTALPGGYLLTTNHLLDAINAGTQMVVIDVLGSGYGLPGAMNAPALASGGSFRDRTQQQAMVWLQQITRNNPSVPVVIYCSDPMCWLSYNASLRAVAAGYTNVYWYRGGVRAWQMAGLPMRPSGF